MKALTALQKHGFSVLPIHTIRNGACSCGNPNCPSPGKHPRTRNGVKDASNDPEVVEHWAQNFPDANVAIATGDAFGFFALDVDLKSGGPENLAKLEAEHGPLPATVEEITGGGGRHLLFRSTGQPVKNRTGAGAILPGVEIKGDGGYLTVAPSRHVSRRRYEWVPGHAPGEISIAEAPEWLLALVFQDKKAAQKPTDKMRQSPAFEGSEALILEGSRNQSLASLAGRLRRQGFEESEVAAALLGINANRCKPPLQDEDVLRIASSICRYPRAYALTDIGNAERLIDQFGHQIRYLAECRRWVIYDGRRWTRHSKLQVAELAKQVARNIPNEIANCPAGQEKELIKWARKSESKERIMAMVELAKSDSRIVCCESDFDRDPLLLNLENGVLDLRDGELKPHQPELMLTKLAQVVFDPAAKCPTWQKALATWFANDEAMQQYLQRALGYMSTGETRQQCVFLAYGTGANGKSVAINTVMGILGEYALQTPVETIMIKAGGGIPNDVARLAGARMVVAMEGESGQKLAESLVKAMSGGDALTARFLYGEFFDFMPQFKLVIVTNHKPIIHGQDHGIWRRIHLIPFEATIAEESRDPRLAEKLLAERSGILNWLLAGCLAWQKEGLKPPEVMMVAKAVYQKEMDPIGNFIEECCQCGSDTRSTGNALYAQYAEWAKDCGEKAISRRLFYRRLREKGFADRNSSSSGGAEFFGISLVPGITGFEYRRNY